MEVRKNGSGQAALGAHAWMFRNDARLVRLRSELEEVELALKFAEQKVPENVRDLDTLEVHLQGGTVGDTRELMDQFLAAYRGLQAYADLLEHRWTLERKIAARKEKLGMPRPN